MRLVWHIVRKDFRRHAVPLACWALLLVLKGEVGVRALHDTSAGADAWLVLRWLETTLVALDAIVCMLLAAALVQEDALAGAAGFWATRPISGGRLLAAKLLGAALMFGALPVAVALRWWMVCGYGPAEMARAALAVVDAQMLPVCVAMALASLTTTLSQFLGWALGLVVVLGLTFYAPVLISEWTHSLLTRGMRETQAVVTVVLAAGAVFAVLGFQFLARRREWALGAASGAMALIAVDRFSVWDISNLWAEAPQASPLASGTAVTVENVTLGVGGSMHFRLQNLPGDLGVRASADHRWTWPDGASVAAWSSFIAGWPGEAEWRALGLARETTGASAREFVGSGPNAPAEKEGMVLSTEFPFGSETRERLAAGPAAYAGDLHAVLFRPAVEFELPLHPGEGRDTTGFSVRIVRLSWRDGEWQVALTVSRPAWMHYGRQRPSGATLLGLPDEPSTGFALVNRARGEGVKLWSVRSPEKLLVGTQEVAGFTLKARLPRDESEKDLDAPPRWLEGATLAVLRYREVGRFDREVKVENFGALVK